MRLRGVLALILTLGSPPASLADPMRPLAPPPAAASGPAPAARTPAAEAAVGRLVAIRRDSTGKRQALIGERWVGVGDRLQGRITISAIDDYVVSIDNGKSRSTLALLPPLKASAGNSAAAAAVAQAPTLSRAHALSTP